MKMILDVEITGVTPLLMNRFNIEDQMAPKAKEKNLTPRESATIKCYQQQDGRLYLPSSNIYACIIEAGKYHKEGKSKVTTARGSLIPAGLLIKEGMIFFSEPSTWEVDSRGVVVPATGGRIVCHRPRLDTWRIGFELELDTAVFSTRTIRTIVDDAGSKVGLGDFRPARKGIYGRFCVSGWKERHVG